MITPYPMVRAYSDSVRKFGRPQFATECSARSRYEVVLNLMGNGSLGEGSELWNQRLRQKPNDTGIQGFGNFFLVVVQHHAPVYI